jgi:hypothetical protein
MLIMVVHVGKDESYEPKSETNMVSGIRVVFESLKEYQSPILQCQSVL